MSYFYENLSRQQDIDIHKAFMAARQRLKENEWIQYVFDLGTFMFEPVVINHDTPEHLNPFIMIDVF